MTPDRLEEMALDYVRMWWESQAKGTSVPVQSLIETLAQARREGAEAERARAERIVQKYAWPEACRDEILRRLKAQPEAAPERSLLEKLHEFMAAYPGEPGEEKEER